MPRGPRTFSSRMEAHWPAPQAGAFWIHSRPPLSPMYRSGPTKARVKIGLWRVVLAMKSTVGVGEVGLLTRAISVGAVVLRFRKPRYNAPVVGSRAAPLVFWPSRPWPGAMTTALLGTIVSDLGSKVTRSTPTPAVDWS